MRIQWTQNERRLLAEAVITIRNSNPTMNLSRAINLAQESVLNPDRHRHITSHAMVSWLEDEISSIERERRHNKSPEVKSIPTDQILRELVSRAESFLIPIVEEIISKSINEEVVNRSVQKAMSEYLASLGMEKNQAPIEKRKKKPMVLLVGLLASQFGHMQSEFGDLLDLRLWNNHDQPMSQLKALSSNAYRIFGMTDFISHSEDTLVANINGANYRRFSGGLTTLRRLLEELYLEQAA